MVAELQGEKILQEHFKSQGDGVTLATVEKVLVCLP